tara:strand:+ start:118989 stop:120116 length:1128 start_codon:yes stop_codon:yes gene_type:complete
MACQSTSSLINYQTEEAGMSLFLDNKFKGHQDIVVETEAEIFALSEDMQQMVKSISSERDTRKKTNKLLRTFFSPDKINLAYQSGANVIAAQAFKDKTANCLSLTIMAYAIAKAAKLDVAFQRVDIPEYWVRNGNVNMLTGHINLTVFEGPLPQKLVFWERSEIEIDFDPFVFKKSFPKHKINKNTVLAMFYNNKGANAMINGNYLSAYAYFKAAIDTDSLFSPAWGNLGILYRFKGFQQPAINTYRYAIKLNRDNLTAMSNLSLLLHINGKYDEAKQLDSQIMRKRANNPYYYALLGDERLHQGNYSEAINHYKKAIKLDDNIHEFYFGLAKTYFMLDEITKAESYIKKAMRHNRISQLDKQYLVKLNLLKQLD